MKVKILLRYTYRNHLNEYSDHVTDFISIDVFKNYLRWEPHRAMQIGYIPRDENALIDTRNTNVRLSILITEGTQEREVPFTNARDFGNYLKNNPAVAAAFNYKPN